MAGANQRAHRNKNFEGENTISHPLVCSSKCDEFTNERVAAGLFDHRKALQVSVSIVINLLTIFLCR